MAALACQTSQPPSDLERLFNGELNVVDMTHALSASSPFWPNPDGNPFRYDTLVAHESGAPAMGAYRTPEHNGTHLDAPIHSADGMASVDELSPTDLMGPAVVVDVSEQCAADPDYLLLPEDLLEWESEHGRIPAGAIVLMYTGWGGKWNDPVAYRNIDADGAMHFPGFGVEAARFLVTDRNIKGIGIDDFSVDTGTSSTFPVHGIVNGAGKFHLENVANLDALPPAGAYLIVAPIKIEGGSGGQVRIFGVITPDSAETE
jgi:kynurenine formamidase